MTDPQTAADAAERVQAEPNWWEMPHGIERELAKYDQCEEPGDCDHDHDAAIEYMREAELNQLRAERDEAVADRARMAAELEQVRGERAALQRLYDGREDDEPHACNGGGIMPCSICGEYTPDAEAQKRFQAAVAADMERARQTGVLAEIEAWEDVETAASAAPDATGDTQTAERRADGLAGLTKLERAQRGSQGDAVDGGGRA